MEINKKNTMSAGRQGFSIIELLISLALLSVVMIITTQTLASSLKNSRKSDSISKTRADVDYAISTMERLLRNAESRVCSTDYKTLTYTDENGVSTSFACVQNSTEGYIASGSGMTKLTSRDVKVICDDSANRPFVCPTPAPGVPETVLITVKAEDVLLQGSVEGSVITSKTKILLRNYQSF